MDFVSSLDGYELRELLFEHTDSQVVADVLNHLTHLALRVSFEVFALLYDLSEPDFGI